MDEPVGIPMEPVHPSGTPVTSGSACRRKWSAFTLSLVLSLLAAEIVFRVLLPPSRTIWPDGMYREDPNPVIGYRLTPNFKASPSIAGLTYPASTNSLGFRGAEPTLGAGVHVIGVFGDSFAFGMGVRDDETFPALLQQALGSRSYQVLNTAVPGQSPAQEHAIYQDLSRRQVIDTVVIQLCDNDVIDQDSPPVRRVRSGRLYAEVPRSAKDRIYEWLVANSALAARCLMALKHRPKEEGMQEFLAADFEVTHGAAIRSTEALLDKWFAVARQRKQRVLVTYVPRRQQVDPGWGPALSRLRAEGNNVDVNGGHRWLEKFMAARPGIGYVNVVAAFRRSYEEGGPPLYFPLDGHTTAAGHRIISQALLRALLPGRDD